MICWLLLYCYIYCYCTVVELFSGCWPRQGELAATAGGDDDMLTVTVLLLYCYIYCYCTVVVLFSGCWPRQGEPAATAGGDAAAGGGLQTAAPAEGTGSRRVQKEAGREHRHLWGGLGVAADQGQVTSLTPTTAVFKTCYFVFFVEWAGDEMCCVEIWQGTRLCFSRDAVCGRDRKKDDPILRSWLLHKSVDRSVKRGIFNDKNVNLLHRYICTCMWENKGVTTCWDDLNLFVSRRNLLRRSQEDRATEYLCLCYLSFCGLLQMVKVKTFVNASIVFYH